MTSEKYRTLLEAVDAGSLSGAAQKLGYTPSAIVHIVNSLERQFGFPVLLRTNKGVSLTADGERILPILREIIRWEDQLYQVSAEVQGMIVGDITIGSYFSIAANWLPEVIRRFHDDYPNVHINVLEGVHQTLDKLIEERRADFCIYSYPPADGCQWIPLKDDPMVAVVPRDHPAASRELFPIDLFSKEPFIMPAEGSDYDITRVFDRHGITPQVSYSTGEDHAAIAMIEAGLGIGLFNSLTTMHLNTSTVNIPLNPPEYASMGVTFPEAGKLSPAARRFIEYLRDYIRSL